MIETNRFQILNPDALKVLQDYGGDITYTRKEMHKSTVLFTPYYLK